jgi:ATP-dependent Zn protease
MGGLLQVRPGGSACGGIITIAATSFPGASDEALRKRAGRFCVHVRMGTPGRGERGEILDLCLVRCGIAAGFLVQKVRTPSGRGPAGAMRSIASDRRS